MLKKNIRICDVCSEEIPKGTKYRIANLLPEAVNIFFKRDINSVPNWTQNPDGTVRLDICLDCHFNMGKALDAKEAN